MTYTFYFLVSDARFNPVHTSEIRSILGAEGTFLMWLCFLFPLHLFLNRQPSYGACLWSCTHHTGGGGTAKKYRYV